MRETTATEKATTTTTQPEAELREEMANAVKKSCDQLVELDMSPSNATVQYDSDWRPLASKDELEAEVAECAKTRQEKAEADRIAAEQKAEADRIAAEQAAQAEIDNAGPINVDEVIKNPDAVTGQVFRLVALIVQYDAGTGPCSFRAYWDNEVREYNFEYAGDNAVFTAGDGTTCPILDGIDQDDTVRLTVRSQGSFSYDTSIGGSTSAPKFEILRAEVVTKG